MAIEQLGGDSAATHIEQLTPDDDGVLTDADGNRHSAEAFENPDHNPAVVAFEALLAQRESGSFATPGDHGEAPL